MFSYFLFVQHWFRLSKIFHSFACCSVTQQATCWRTFCDVLSLIRTLQKKVLQINTRCSAEYILALTRPTYRPWLTTSDGALFSV
jgi:hypothetical protein